MATAKGETRKGAKPKKLYPSNTGSGTFASPVKPKKPKPSSYGNFGTPVKGQPKPSIGINKFLKNTTADRTVTPGEKTWKGLFQSKFPKGSGALSNNPRSGSGPKGSGAAIRSAPSVGGSGGNTSSVKHNPGTGKPGHRNGGGGAGGGRGGAGGGSGFGGGNYLKQARRYVNSDIKKQMDALRNEIDARRNDMQYANNQANSLYNRSEGDLRHIFGEASEQNNLQTKAILDRILSSQGDTNQVYDQLGAQQQQNTGANQAALMSELGRLGIQQSADLGQFSADANFSQNMAEQNRTNSLDNLGAMGGMSAGIGNLINQMSNSSMASNIGKQLNLRNDNISANRQNFMSQKDEVRDAMRQEKLGKGGRIWDLFRELEDQGYNRWFQNREANRSNALGWSNFNLSADGQNADIAFQKAQMLADQRAAAAERRAIQNQMRNLGGGGGGNGGNFASGMGSNALNSIFGFGG